MGDETNPANPKAFRVGLMSFSDGRLRVHQTLEDTIKSHGSLLAEAIGKDPMLQPVAATQIVHSSKIARGVASEMKAAGIEVAVFNRMNIQPREFIDCFNTSHAHVIPRDHTMAIRYYCDLGCDYLENKS